MICVSALFAFEFLADATRLSIRILIQRLFPLEKSKNFTVSVGESKLPLESLSIPLGYLACTARKRTFYYKRFLRDWFFIIMLRLLRGKYPSHRKNKSTFQLLYLYASSSWRGKSDLLKYLKYCPCTCRQSDQDDNINAIKTLFPLWLFNIAFLKTIYIMQSQMPSGHLLLSCVKMAATAKISSFAYLR